MRSDNQIKQRMPVYDVLGPLGWTYKMLADAVQYSVATVHNDLRDRGGLTGAYPDRPMGGDVYAATFLHYTRNSFPSERIQKIAEDFLQVEKIIDQSEGMGRAMVALQSMPNTRAFRNYNHLIQEIFGNDRRTAPWGASDGCGWWVGYIEGVKRGEVLPPKSEEDALNGIATLFQESVNRSRIILSMPPPGLLFDALSNAFKSLTERERYVITRCFSLDSGGEPRTVKQVAREMGLSAGRVRQIKISGLQRLEEWSDGKRSLSWFFRDIDDCLQDEKELRQEVDRLRDRVRSLSKDVFGGGKYIVLSDGTVAPVNTTDPVLLKRVEDLPLSGRSTFALRNAGIEYLYQLVVKTPAECLKIKNFGRHSLREICDVLGDFGLNLGMTLPALGTVIPHSEAYT